MTVEYLGSSKPVNQLKPLLSVRLITFNHAPYIRQCVDSVLMQVTDFPFEIVIGEDDSTDGTREICIEYANRYPNKIRLLLRSKQDKIILDGVTTSRYNFAETMKDCRGKFIALLDGDDYWTDPHKLQLEADALSRDSSLVLTFHGAHYVNGKGRRLSISLLSQNQKRDVTSTELQQAWGLQVTSTLCIRNAIAEFPTEFYEVLVGDKFLISLLGKHGSGKYLSAISPSAYRLHETSMYSALSAVKELEFRRHMNGKLSTYYTRLGEAELSVHFATLEKKLGDIADNPGKKLIFVFKRWLFRFQLKFLHDSLRHLWHRIT